MNRTTERKPGRGSRAKPQVQGAEDTPPKPGFERVSGPGPKDSGKGAAGPLAKDRLDRNH
jgi:hypothetical protein